MKKSLSLFACTRLATALFAQTTIQRTVFLKPINRSCNLNDSKVASAQKYNNMLDFHKDLSQKA
jgi:hypothetical protein